MSLTSGGGSEFKSSRSSKESTLDIVERMVGDARLSEVGNSAMEHTGQGYH